MVVKPFYFMGHYQSWWKSRLQTLDHILAPNFLKDKTVLDLGSGFGTFAYFLHLRGANIICSDGREEFIDIIKNRYKEFQTRLEDYNDDIDYPEVDIISHFSVLQYIDDFEKHLKQLIGKSKYILLETDVLDSNDENMKIIVQQNAYDQSLKGKSTYTSEKCIENVLTTCEMSFIQIRNTLLDTMVHKYNWDIKNTNTVIPGQGRFWICAQKGYKLTDVLSKMANINISKYLDNIPDELRNIQKPFLYPYEHIETLINDKVAKIILYIPEPEVRNITKHLERNGYIIYDKYNSHILTEFVCVLAASSEANKSEKFSFVVHGLKSGKTTELAKNIYFTYGIVIDATWKDEELEVVKKDITDKKIHNKQNIYPHVLSTLSGLKQVRTPFAIKVRADEFYSDMSPILSELESNPDKIITNNIFARKVDKYQYHVSDHIIAGTIENMNIMFIETLNVVLSGAPISGYQLSTLVAEQKLLMAFLIKKTGCTDLPKTNEECKKLMKTYCRIVTVRKLGLFQVKANSVIRHLLTSQCTPRLYRSFVDLECIDEI